MPGSDYPPGAFTAPATQQSVQHKLNQKGVTHEMAMAELESIAYPCPAGRQCKCNECTSFGRCQTVPDFAPYDHDSDITLWLDREERQQDRREALRRMKTRAELHAQAYRQWEKERMEDPYLEWEPPMIVSERLEHRWVLVYDPTSGRKRSERQVNLNCEEIWSMCIRMWEVGLYLSHRVGKDAKLFITVAANCDILSKQAADMELPMRLKETMGMVPYKPEWAPYYIDTPNHTHFNSAQEQQLVMRLMDKGWRIPLEHRMSLPPREDVLHRLKSKMSRNLSVSATFLCRLFTTFGAYRVHDHAFKDCCPRAHAAAELTEKDKYFTVHPDINDEDVLQEFAALGDSALRISGVEDAAEIATQAAQATSKAALKFAKATSKHSSKVVKAAALTARGKQDKHLGKAEVAKLQEERYKRLGWTELTYLDLHEIVSELEAWLAGANSRTGTSQVVDIGVRERFTGLLVDYFPTHDYEEMQFFRKSWADLKLVLKFRMRARNNEGKYTEGAHYNPYAASNSWAGEKNKPWQCTLWYQPVDEIRDYFGDETALYFAWLGVYTKSLGMQSLFGVVTMIFGMIQNRGDIDPDLNDFTMFYSVSVAVWSVMFLQQWHRRENELRFLWGTESLAENQTPRMEFKGKLDINKVTGRETIVEKGWVRGFSRKVFSWTVVMLMMALTIASALLAESLNTKKDTWYNKFDVDDNKYLDVLELRELFTALNQAEESVVISDVQADVLLANWFNGTLFDPKEMGWDDSLDPIGPYNISASGVTQSIPVCDVMRGQCLGKSVCANWVADGDCRTMFNATLGIPVHAGCEQSRDKDVSYQPGGKFAIFRSTEPAHLEQCEPGPETEETTDTVPRDMGRCGCVNFNAVWKRTAYRDKKVPFRTLKEAVDENMWVGIGGLTNLILLQTFGTIFRGLADKLNFFENHRLEEIHNKALILKIFLFEFVNNYFVMFYIAYLRHIEFPVGVPQKCDKSCLGELQTKLFIVFTGKTLFKKVPEYIVPALKKHFALRGADSTDEELEVKKETGQFKMTVEEQARMHTWDGMFDDFSQMVTQFGYLALFAPACSLAPLLAFVNNVTEIRTDAWAVCNLSQRPTWKSVDSIGAWATVLKALAVVAVIVNSTMVFFVGSQMACPMDKDQVIEWYNKTDGCLYGIGGCSQGTASERPTFAERKLGGFLCSFGGSGWSTPASSKTDCPVVDPAILEKQGSFLFDPYSSRTMEWYMGDEFELDGIGYRVTVSRLWIWAVCMEHVVLILRFGLSAMAPTEPLWVETAKDTLAFKVEKMKHDDFDSVVDREGLLKRRAGRKSAKEAFARADTDMNGRIDMTEWESLLISLDMKLDKEDIVRIWRQIDLDGDGFVSFEEFDIWWCLNGGKNKFQLKDAREIFRELDTDGSGTLDKAELMQLCHHLGMKSLTDKQATKLMNEIDVDGDGDISIDEFDIWWQENGGAKYRRAPIPGPGDMSSMQKFNEKRQFIESMDRKKKFQSQDFGASSSPRHSDFDVEDSTPRDGTTRATVRRGAAKAGDQLPRLCACPLAWPWPFRLHG